ncbi:MAG: filamentous hemagglutinin N-terminal domain-containing protein, partial [Pseudomonadota bacterium]
MSRISYQKIAAFFAEKIKILILIITAGMTVVAYGNPVLNNVTAGNVNVTQSGNTVTVNQSTDKAIIQWNSFNIAAGEKTQFVQPNSGSVALNRINPTQGASQIYGSLTANGQVILVNAAGIHFGPGAMVNVGSLIASTSDIANANFLAGKLIFNVPSQYGGSIINEGTIQAADYGLVALLGTSVVNRGVIQARLGNIALGSGNAFTLDFNGDQLINFTVDAAATTAGVDQNGHPLANGISNTGSLLADGGKILVTAQVAQGVLDNVIDMQGVSQARSVGEQNGEIILSGGDNSTVQVSGTLDASGKSNGQTGGTVKVLGNQIHLTSTALIDASGDAGGGTALVGGNQHGAGPEQNALNTSVDAGSLINASAINTGNGGVAVAWADDTTIFNGLIKLNGGSISGNGGHAEVSGHQQIIIDTGFADVKAPHGKNGSLLLDPGDVVVGSTSGLVVYNPGFDTTGNIGQNTTVLSAAFVNSQLAVGDFTIEGTDESHINGLGIGNIWIRANLSWDTNSSLYLLSDVGVIYIQANIQAPNGGLVLSAPGTYQYGEGGSPATDGGTTGYAPTISAGTFTYMSGDNGFFSEGNNAGSTINANIDVLTFLLQAGTMDDGGSGTFSAPNDFEINNGSTFVRQQNNVISDIYGLQGLGGPNYAAIANGNEFIANWNFHPDNPIDIFNSIDASITHDWNGGAGFIPLGTASAPFAWKLDAHGNVISQLFINSDAPSVGLFGEVTGTIFNLRLVNVSITSNSDSISTGGFVGQLDSGGILDGDSVEGGSVTGDNTFVGGFVGLNAGTIVESSSVATVILVHAGYLGGFVGFNNGNINEAYAIATIATDSPTNFADVGGFVGLANDGSIDNTYAVPSFGVPMSNPNLHLSAWGNEGVGTGGNNYYDITTSGVSNDGGAGNATALTDAQMHVYSNFSGFDFTSQSSNSGTWAIPLGGGYPILTVDTPGPYDPLVVSRVISGTVTGGAGDTLNFVYNGSLIGSTTADGSGNYSFSTGSITDGDAFLVYIATGVLGNAISTAPTSNGNLTLNFAANAITIGDTTNSNSFSNSTLATTLNCSSGCYSAAGVLFSASGNNLTLSSGSASTINFTTTSLTSYVVNGSITFSGGATGAMTFNGATTVSGNISGGATTVTFNNNATSIAANITSSGGQTYNNAVTLAGTTNLNSTGGLVTFNSSVDLSGFSAQFSDISDSHNITNSSGTAVTLTLAPINSDTFAGSLSGNLALKMAGSGSLTLSGANTYTGATTLQSGTLILGNSSSLSSGNLNLNGGALATNATLSIGNAYFINNTADIGGSNNITLSGLGTFSTGSTLNIDNTGTTKFGALSGAAAGNGTLAGLSGAGLITFNGVVGATTLNSISIAGTTNISTSGISTSGTQSYSNNVTLGANTTLTGTSVSVGAVGGAFNLTLSGSSGNTLNGNISIGSLTLNGGSTDSIASGVTAITTSGNQLFSDAINFGGSFTDKSGSGTITYSGNVSGSGQTLTLQDATAGSTGAVTFNGNVTLGGLVTFGSLANYAVALNGTGTNTITNATTFNNTGGVTLGSASTSALTFTGGLISTAGTTTTFGAVNTTNTAMSLAALTLAGNTTLDSGTSTIGVSGNVTGSKTLSLQDASASGTVTLGGNLTITGLTTFAGSYAVALNGTGTNTITNATTFNNTGGVTLGSASTSALTFTNGLTSTAGTTTTFGAINTTNTAISLAALTLAGNTTLKSGTSTIGVSGNVTGSKTL